MKKLFAVLTICFILMNLSIIPAAADSGSLQSSVFFQNKSSSNVAMWLGHSDPNAGACLLGPNGHSLYYCLFHYDKQDSTGYYVNDKAYASVLLQGAKVEDALSGTFAIRGYLKGVSVIYDGNALFAKITYQNGKEEVKTIKTVGQTETTEALPVAGAMLTLLPAVLLGVVAMKSKGGSTGNKEGDKSKKKIQYLLAISKEFGNKVRCDEDAVTISAAIIEVNIDESGAETEVIMPDMSEIIEIKAKEDFVELSDTVMEEGYKKVNFMAHSNEKGLPPADTLTLIFTFRNERGYLTQNLIFKVIGKPYIELEKETLFVLAASEKTFDLKYVLKDFASEAEIVVNCFQNDKPFTLEVSKNAKKEEVIRALDQELPQPIESFYNRYNCEIIASNDKEYAREVFNVVMCHEGLLPDFLGKRKEICAYKDENEELKEIVVAFRVGIWNDSIKTLDFITPTELTIDCMDEQGIFDVIGIDYELEESSTREDAVLYKFKTQKSLPATEPVKGTLAVSCRYEERDFESETEIKLIPDLLQYEADFEKEYKNCLKIINTYLPENIRSKKLKQLDLDLAKLGIADLKLFRENCWKIAERCILQDKENYLIDSYWYDEAIAASEVLVYIGDVAFDVALAPFGGPIAGFLASQVKGAFIDFLTMYVEKPSIGFNEVKEFAGKRYVQLVGQGDGAFEMPKPGERKKLIAWLVGYTIYRMIYHWWYDKDDNDRAVGAYEAVKRGIVDLIGKGASTILSAFAGDIAKEKGWDKYSITDADQKITNDTVSKIAGGALQAGDKVAKKLDDIVAEAVKTLTQFIEMIKNGVVIIG